MDINSIYNMFVPGAPFLEKIARSLLVYLFLVVGLRLAGKREMAQLNPFDFVVLLILSNSVQNAIIGNDNSITGGIISAIVLLGINYLLARYLYSHVKSEAALEGKADVLIDHGHIQYRNLRKELITLADLEIAAHKQGYRYIQDIDHCTIEPGGAFTFIAKKPPADEARHEEIIKILNAMKREITLLKTAR